ncbi:MAG TPA: FAD:protein FMN transferase, partial [Candidatus Acidoferrales bacterium]
MKYILSIFAAVILAPGLAGSSTSSGQRQLYVFQYENVLGTSLEIKVAASSEAQSEKAERAALAEIDREARILSSWDADSEFSKWFRTMDQPVPVSPELYEVFSLFDKWRELTNGALDPSAETITRVWKKAAAENRLPSRAELDAAVASVRRVHWRLNPANRTATHTSDAPLALNSFVKSYIAGRAAEAALRASGAQGLVINIGGDLVVRGDWKEPVDVSDPKSDAENGIPIARLVIKDRTIATSGDYRRGVEIGGHHYSHIVDPRTGMTADQIISSTVIAESP